MGALWFWLPLAAGVGLERITYMCMALLDMLAEAGHKPQERLGKVVHT
jgi:hypothetical protein